MDEKLNRSQQWALSAQKALGIRGDGCKLEGAGLRLATRKQFWPMGVERHWDRLPRGAVEASSLEKFKGRLGRGLEQAGLGGGVHAHGRGCGNR